MLNARRKQKAAATATTTTTTKTTKKAAKKDTTDVKGPLRSIALGRRYKEYEAPMDDDGTPLFRSIFDPQGRSARAITAEDVPQDRVVNNSAFVEHINETVFKPIFGMALRRKVARHILDGISDQCLVLTEQGWKIKLPNLVTMERVQRAARKARNPRTGAEVSVPARAALSAKATRSARAYMAEQG